MLFLHCFTPWGPGALYAELYLGLCRALVAPWLGPARAPEFASRASACPPAQGCAATEAPAAAATSAATEAGPPRQAAGAAIIPFDRTRARRAPHQLG